MIFGNVDNHRQSSCCDETRFVFSRAAPRRRPSRTRIIRVRYVRYGVFCRQILYVYTVYVQSRSHLGCFPTFGNATPLRASLNKNTWHTLVQRTRRELGWLAHLYGIAVSLRVCRIHIAYAYVYVRVRTHNNGITLTYTYLHVYVGTLRVYHAGTLFIPYYTAYVRCTYLLKGKICRLRADSACPEISEQTFRVRVRLI